MNNQIQWWIRINERNSYERDYSIMNNQRIILKILQDESSFYDE